MKNILFLGLLFFTQACAVSSDASRIDISPCVASKVGQIAFAGREKLLPEMSPQKVTSEEIHKLVLVMPSQERRRIVAVTANDVHRANLDLSTSASIEAIHDKIYQSYVDRASSIYNVESCGGNEETGARVFVILQDWLLSPYGNHGVLKDGHALKAESGNMSAYDLPSVVITAVVLEANGISYDMEKLKIAFGHRH